MTKGGLKPRRVQKVKNSFRPHLSNKILAFSLRRVTLSIFRISHSKSENVPVGKFRLAHCSSNFSAWRNDGGITLVKQSMA